MHRYRLQFLFLVCVKTVWRYILPVSLAAAMSHVLSAACDVKGIGSETANEQSPLLYEPFPSHGINGIKTSARKDLKFCSEKPTKYN